MHENAEFVFSPDSVICTAFVKPQVACCLSRQTSAITDKRACNHAAGIQISMARIFSTKSERYVIGSASLFSCYLYSARSALASTLAWSLQIVPEIYPQQSTEYNRVEYSAVVSSAIHDTASSLFNLSTRDCCCM